MSRVTAHAATLEGFLAQAAEELAESDAQTSDTDAEGLLFLGNWHQSYPAILVRDPFLSDSAKVHFLYLMQESSHNPRGSIAMPSLETTARELGHSRKTAGRDRTLLRVCRWISLCHQVRDRGGRWRGSIHAIHSEPCGLADANRLDRDYLSLLHEAQSHRDAQLRTAAIAALGGIDQALDDGRDPLEPTDPIDRRLQAAAAVEGRGTSFFDLQIRSCQKGGHPVATPDRHGEVEKFTHGEPWVNITDGQNPPCVNFTHGQQLSDKKEVGDNHPQKEKFTHGYRSSSSSKKTTTTTDPTHLTCASADKSEPQQAEGGHPVTTQGDGDQSNTPGANDLRWPGQFDANTRHLIYRALLKQQIASDRYQDVVDVLARKARDPDDPLRSPVGYAVRLCKRVQNGDFNSVGPPASGSKQPVDDDGNADANAKALRSTRSEIQTVQSEIDGLEQNLIPMADAGTRHNLEQSRDRYRERLDALKQRYRELRCESEPVPQPQWA